MSIKLPSPATSPHIAFGRSEIVPEGLDEAARVLRSGWLTTGPEVAEFEREFAEWVGATHATAVSSCTAAIELSLRALRLPPGAKVLTSTMTFCGAVHAIVHAGLRPVLVDVDAKTLMPDPATTAWAVRHEGPSEAMVVTHFGGYPAPVEQMAEAAGLPLDRVVEDAAHALGASVGNRAVGTISAATCFSFYATKNLPIGEGGMVTTHDPEIADYVRRGRLHGMSRDAWKRYMPGSGWRYEVDMAGLKANMTDVQAAIGRAQLRAFPKWQARREALAARYDRRLSKIPGIVRAPRPQTGRHAWHLYVIRVEPTFGMDRDSFIAALAERGVDCSVHFIPVHHQTYFLRLLGSHLGEGFPVANEVFERIVSLPLYQSLSDEDVDRVCSEIAHLRVPGMTGVSNGNGAHGSALRCLIVGAGTPGRTIAHDLRPLAEFGVRAIGYLDDQERRGRVGGLPVLGRTADLLQAVTERSVDLVIVAMPWLTSREIRRLAQVASIAGVRVRYLPASGGQRVGEPRIGDLKDLRARNGDARKAEG